MKRSTIILLLGAVVLSSSVFATQPTPANIQMDTELVGSTLVVKLRNLEKEPALVEVSSGPQASLSFSPSRAEVGPNQDAQLKFSVTGEGKGKQVVHIQTRVMTQKEVGILPGPSLYQPYWVEGRVAKKLTYEEAFLAARERIDGKSEVAKIDLGGTPYVSEIARFGFKADSVPREFKVEPTPFRNIAEYLKLGLRQLPKDISVGQGTPQGFNIESTLEDSMNSSDDSSWLESRSSINTPKFTMNSVTIRGNLSLKVSTTSYKAAWGWVVRAWQNVGGIWIFLGWTYVNSDGSWQLALNTVVPGVPVRVEYQTKNRFVSIQDANGNPYTWGDNWNLTGSVTDIGNRYANLTVNGDLPSVDKLYAGATQIWVKFYNNGMNALRDQPIQVFFPNTLASGRCINNDGSGPYAWSCSYWGDGKIYIIPAHGSESVVQHEIGHSINSFYWNGSMPAGSGGSHNLWNCYNNGLALTEGFANFITYWTQFDRGNSSPVAPYFNMNLENLPNGVCANQMGEMRVAAAFWDLYDSRSETASSSSADSLYYINQAVPISLYLNNNRSAMSDYLPIVQAGQSAYWQGEFTKLFKLNKIIN